MDIKDLDLSQVEALKGRDCVDLDPCSSGKHGSDPRPPRRRGYVGVGKHLCGAATDLALRCMMNQQKMAKKKGGCGLMGVAIALCCHHRCSWQHLVGSEFMTQLGFTSEDFHLLSHMTSWAVCGQRPPGGQDAREEEGE